MNKRVIMERKRQYLRENKSKYSTTSDAKDEIYNDFYALNDNIEQ